MANQVHFDELKKGVKSWNAWVATQRSADPNFKPDLTEIDLNNLNIIGTGLYNPTASGSRAFLYKADFRRAYLSNAILDSAFLVKAQFQEANLTRVSLKSADLREAVFSLLDYSDPRPTSISPTFLNEAVLDGADLRRADLRDAHITAASLRDSCMIHTKMKRAAFRASHLEGANLSESSLEEAIFLECNLQSATMSAVKLSGTKFDSSNLKCARLSVSSMDDLTSFLGTLFYDCFISIDDKISPRIAINTIAQGFVNSVQFADPVFGRKVRDQAWLNKWLENIEQLKSKNRKKYLGMKAWAWFWRVSSDYGRSFGRWSVWSAFIVVLFALLYKFFPESLHYNHLDSVTRFTPLYFSSVIFTTLGFGDISPKTLWFEIWVTIEVLLGYLMLGGLISIFATIVARRND